MAPGPPGSPSAAGSTRASGPAAPADPTGSYAAPTSAFTGALPREAALPLACLTAIAVVEIVIAEGGVLAGQIADAVLLLLIVNAGSRGGRRSSLVDSDATAVAMWALALVPLARVVALGLPLHGQSRAVSTLIVILPMALAATILAPAVGVRRRVIVSVRFPAVQLAAALAGLALGFIAYLGGSPPLTAGGSASRVLAALAVAAAAAIVEEFLFRGLVQLTLQRVAGASAVVPVAALSAALYLGSGSAAPALVMATAGLAFGTVVARTGVLSGAVAGHVLLGVGAGVLWPVLLGGATPAWPGEQATTVVLATTLVAATVLTLLARARSVTPPLSLPPMLRPAASSPRGGIAAPPSPAGLGWAALPLLATAAVTVAGVAGYAAGRGEHAASGGQGTTPAQARAEVERERYLRTASTVLDRLDARRAAGRRALARTKTPLAQESAALGLAADYRAAYRRLRAPPPAVRAGPALASALRQTAAAYGLLAVASAQTDAAAYRSAAQAVDRGEARLARAVAILDRP